MPAGDLTILQVIFHGDHLAYLPVVTSRVSGLIGIKNASSLPLAALAPNYSLQSR